MERDRNSVASASVSTTDQLQRGTDLYAQLEVMMGAVRNESAQLAAAKEQVAELEQKNKELPKLMAMLQLEQEQNAGNTRRLNEAEIVVAQLRSDMQRLNDIYSKERKVRSDTEQHKQRLASDLETSNRNLHSVTEDLVRMRDQIASQRKELDEANYKFGLEKNELVRSLSLVRTELEESEKAKKEVSLHFWNIKQDTERLQERLVGTVQENAELRRQLSLAASRVLGEQEGLLMQSEDQRSELQRVNARSGEQASTIKHLQIETKQLYQAIQIQEAQAARLSKQLSEVSGDAQNRVHEVEAERANLSRLLEEERRVVQTQSAEIESMRDKAGAAAKLEIVKQQLESENERLKSALKSKEESLISVETSLSQLMATREQELMSTASNGSFIEQLEAQLKTANESQWAAEREASERIQALTVELATANRSAEDAAARIESMKNEKIRYEEFMKQEIQNAGQLGTVLKNELELRLEELSLTRKERDALKAQVEELNNKVIELNVAINRSDAQFREVLEADRAKIQQDLRVKSNRCRTLEAEKQELLSETSSLMKQVHDNQVKRDAALAQVERSAQEMSKAQEDIDNLSSRVSDLTKELKSAQRREKEMADEFASKEKEFRQDVAKLDSVIKASAKSATSQVSEMAERVRVLTSTTEEQKLRIASLESAEKKILSDGERRSEEMRILSERHEASLQQVTVELTAVRRDLSETRQRFKLSQDDNLKKEREIMSLQTEANKLEAEIHRYRDRLRDAEDRGISAAEQVSSCRREIDNLSTELRRVRASLADQDQVLIAKQRVVDRAERELKALEQEGFAETKKLRAKLKEAVGELDALRSSEIPRLRKELEDATSNHGKLQTSNSATISGLIAEVNATEDALTQERRAREAEAAQYQAQIRELQINLEKANEVIAECNSKASVNNSEKSARFNFLEGEVERLKATLAQREERVFDLEKQQQGGRLAMQGFRDSQVALEQSLSEARRALETETAARRALEDTVRRLGRQSLGARGDNGSDEGSGDEAVSVSRRKYLSESSDAMRGRPISPIDVNAGGGCDGEEEEDGYTRGTAMSSLSGSSWSPSKGRDSGRESPVSIGEVKRYSNRERSNPELRMSPVDEGLHVSTGSPNNRSAQRAPDSILPCSNARSVESFPARLHRSIAQESEPPLSAGRSTESYSERLQKSVKFNVVKDYDDDREMPSPSRVPAARDVDAGSVASVDTEAEDMINRTQMYLQQRLANKNVGGKAAAAGASRFATDRGSVLSYAAPVSSGADAAPELGHRGDSDDGDRWGDIEEEDEQEEQAYPSSAEYEPEETKQSSVRRKKTHSLKKTKKKKHAPRIEFVGQPGNFHIQAMGGGVMHTSASVDNIRLPHIGGKER